MTKTLPLILGRCPSCDSPILRSELNAKVFSLNPAEDCVCEAVRTLDEARALCAQPREQSAVERRKALRESSLFRDL